MRFDQMSVEACFPEGDVCGTVDFSKGTLSLEYICGREVVKKETIPLDKYTYFEGNMHSFVDQWRNQSPSA